MPPIRQLHETIRQAVIRACEQTSLEEMSQIAREKQGDTIRVRQRPYLGVIEPELQAALSDRGLLAGRGKIDIIS